MLGVVWLRGFWTSPLPPPSSRASRGLVIVLFCNALDCIALHCSELHCNAAALLRSHLVSCCIAGHQQACFFFFFGCVRCEAGLRSCHSMSRHVVSCIASCHVMSRYVTSCPVISARVTFGSSSGILSLFSCHVTSSCHKQWPMSRREPAAHAEGL